MIVTYKLALIRYCTSSLSKIGKFHRQRLHINCQLLQRYLYFHLNPLLNLAWVWACGKSNVRMCLWLSPLVKECKINLRSEKNMIYFYVGRFFRVTGFVETRERAWSATVLSHERWCCAFYGILWNY